MILYEYPFNERIRTCLRLEHLFGRLGQLLARESSLDHHFALLSVFEVMDVTSRPDLKPELMRELERHKAQLAAFRGNPAISEASLELMLERLDSAASALNAQFGKPGHDLLDNEFLMSLRSRAVMPAGTCSFDLPAYHAWQQHPGAQRRADLQGWAGTLMPLAHAVTLVLQILRDSGTPQKVMATGGQFHQALPHGRAFQLLRLRIASASRLIPEITAHRLMASVRLMRMDADGKLHAARDDAALEIALCS